MVKKMQNSSFCMRASINGWKTLKRGKKITMSIFDLTLRVNERFLSNLVKVVKLQTSIKKFLKRRKGKRTHKPNISSVRLKANRLSFTNFAMIDEGILLINKKRLLMNNKNVMWRITELAM